MNLFYPNLELAEKLVFKDFYLVKLKFMVEKIQDHVFVVDLKEQLTDLCEF